MRRILAIVLFCPLAAFAQQRKTIDSINNLSYDVKINRAATIDTLFLQNAAAAEKIKYQNGAADSYSNLGLIYYYRGQYEKSVSARIKAIKGYEFAKNREKLAHEYGELGYAMKRRNMPRAQYYMRKGMQIAESDSILFRLAGIYDNYGVLKEMQNELDSAMLFYNRGLKLKIRLADSVGIPYSLNNIAGIYVMTKRYREAEPLYKQALEIRERRNDVIGMSESYSSIGSFFAETKQYAKATENFEKAIALSLQGGYIHNAAMNYKNLADLYETRGNKSAAYDNYKNYVLYKDSILNKETNAKIAEMEVQFETHKKEKLLLQKEAEVKQQNVLLIGACVVAVFLALIGFLVYRQQKLKRRQQAQEHELKTAIAQIETQSKLQNQRLDISRDLHDNIGAQLTFIISSMDNIRYAFDLKDSRLEAKLQSIGNFTKETIIELRDTIWAMNHNKMSFEDLRVRILNFIEKAKEAVGEIGFRFTIGESLGATELTSVQGMNIYRTIQEAVNNALKYASASEIAIDISGENQLSIDISDNGLGFDESNVELGNGILNMQNRMANIGGTFRINSAPGSGTKIHIDLPLNYQP